MGNALPHSRAGMLVDSAHLYSFHNVLYIRVDSKFPVGHTENAGLSEALLLDWRKKRNKIKDRLISLHSQRRHQFTDAEIRKA